MSSQFGNREKGGDYVSATRIGTYSHRQEAFRPHSLANLLAFVCHAIFGTLLAPNHFLQSTKAGSDPKLSYKYEKPGLSQSQLATFPTLPMKAGSCNIPISLCQPCPNNYHCTSSSCSVPRSAGPAKRSCLSGHSRLSAARSSAASMANTRFRYFITSCLCLLHLSH